MAEAETSLFHKGVAFLSSVNPFTGRRHSGSNFSHSIERIDEGATPTPSLKAEDNLPQPLRRSRSLDARSSVEEREVLAVVTPSPFDIPNSPPPRAPSRGTYLDASNFIFPKSAANQIDGAATETDAINAPNSPALPKVLPADDVSSHVMCYLFLPGMLPDSPEPGDPDYIPTKERHKALLPSELFVDMYKDFSRRRGFEPTLGLSHQDMYAIFSTVVLDYGSALDEAHSNIDWSSLCIKLGLSDSIANNMVEIYLRQLAPLVALWLAQIRLRECFSDLELEVSLQAWDLATRRDWDLTPLLRGLNLIAIVLGITREWHHFIDSHGFQGGIDAWLHSAAADDTARRVICELKGSLARIMLDILDEMLRTSEGMPMSHPVTTLYISLVQNSLNMPSRFWINPIQYHSSDHYLAGGVRVYPCIISAENVSVLVTWTDGKQSCPKMWDAHKSFLRAIAIQSQCRHPNIMPIRGVFLDEYEFEPLRIVCATIPKLQIRYPFYHDLSDVCRLIAGLGAGLGYLHMHEVIHDDLQWPNAVIDEACHIRLWNFGMSRSHLHETSMITRRYYWNESRPFPTSKRNDIYSCGIMFLATAMASPSNDSMRSSLRMFNEARERLEEMEENEAEAIDMPAKLKHLHQLTLRQGEALWNLICDMANLDRDMDMLEVNSRLGSIFRIEALLAL